MLTARLFLTSKVRLHCDDLVLSNVEGDPIRPFPDLKGQAPLRRVALSEGLQQQSAAFS